MAHFMAEAQGKSTAATRTGTEKSGALAEVSGWEDGVRVIAEVKDGKDVFWIYMTGGSNRSRDDELIGTVIEGCWYPRTV